MANIEDVPSASVGLVQHLGNARPQNFLRREERNGIQITLQVRADVDEINASHVRPGAAAVAHLKGDAERSFPLKFVRIDPYMIPKQSLTGSNSERVDVRVLEVIYSFDPPPFPVYAGQQVDVFINGDRGQ